MHESNFMNRAGGMLNQFEPERERGLVLVLAAVFAVVFVTLCALAIGLGLVLNAQTRLQNMANAASMAAIESWVSQSESETTFAARAQSAANRATEFLQPQQNKLFGQRDPNLGGNPVGSLYPSFISAPAGAPVAGRIRLGMMYQRDPGDGSNPCAQYPCFRYYNSASPAAPAPVNAVQVDLQPRSDNPVLAPFAALLGHELFRPRAVATATLVERCSAFLIDVSLSSMVETHDPIVRATWFNYPGAPKILVRDPTTHRVFALRSGEALANVCLNVADEGLNGDRIAWCNAPPRRPRMGAAANPAPWDGNSLPAPHQDVTLEIQNGAPPNTRPMTGQYQRLHYRDDYRKHEWPEIAFPYPIDTDDYQDSFYQGPEPFTTYMLAFNTALRKLEKQATGMDVVTVKAFAGRKRAEIPPFAEDPSPIPPWPYPDFTKDLGYAIQITNPLNRGTFGYRANGMTEERSPKVYPNFLTHGFFPLKNVSNEEGGTNLVEILDETIDELSTVCHPNSKKQIILATDGVNTCSYVTHDAAGVRYPSGNDGSRSCAGDKWQSYQEAEKQLLYGTGAGFYDPPPNTGNPLAYPSILQRLIQSEISLTVLTSGDSIEPNFLNIRDPSCTEVGAPGVACSPNLFFLKYIKGIALGYSGLSGSNDFFEDRSSCREFTFPNPACDQLAFVHLGLTPDYVFRRVNGVLGRLAIQSGGLWCPLMPLDPVSAHYDANGELNDAYRTLGAPQTYSILNFSKAQMAAACASEAVGHNPYLLSEPLNSSSIGAGGGGAPS